MSELPVTSAQVRGKLVDALTLDLIGPIADPSREHERLKESPSRWYLTGFLVTRDRPSRDLPKEDEDEEDDDDLFGSDDDPIEEPTADTVVSDDSDKTAAATPVKRQVLPSSLGLSVLVPKGTKTLEVTVCWGDYHPEYAPEAIEGAEVEEPFSLASAKPAAKPRKHRKIVAWSRVPRTATRTISLERDFTRGAIFDGVPGSDGLVLYWLSRPAPQEALDQRLVPGGASTVNVYLVNERQGIHGSEKDRSLAFQAELQVRCALGFVPRPSLSGLRSTQSDDREADLQYRDVYEFAVGHNVSAMSEIDAEGRCHVVRTAWIPEAEVERVEPAKLQGITLSMEALGKLADFDQAKRALIGLADQYEAWVIQQAKTKLDLYHDLRVETCKDLLEHAQFAAGRIRQGIEELKEPKAFRAFTLANTAMGMQARRRDALNKGKRDDEVNAPTWHPFQLAFLLLNLKGMIHPADPERDTVDLLFFPTGGGKTEAYLGLAAFTLLYRRFREGTSGVVPRYAGVTVLMRYTLRLLTLDQLSRATALMCALELLRKNAVKELGTWPFEVGLWVGSAATPNSMGTPGDAYGVASRVLDYKLKKTKRPPVPLEKCPWCGAELSPDCFTLVPDERHARELSISCLGEGCDFTGDNRLPIHMVDEPIYNRLPGFLIATVDKFAAMPWKGEVAKLFGRVKAYQRTVGFLGDCDDVEGIELDDCLPPPELVIQDELHLISGPLGTIAGLYETAIDRLCQDQQGRGPKIVSSTATVRRASDQIRALFGRGDVRIFPPLGPDRRNSFFAETVTDSSTARMYLGVAAQGRSAKRVLLKTYLALMSAAAKLYQDCGGDQALNNPVDPYMTMLGYFNSLRELGGTRRLVEDEVTSRLNQYGKRRRLGETECPFIDRAIREPQELTSRYHTAAVAQTKDALNAPFRLPTSLDVALATNMISVGLDIPRLGLMAVFGQPKMTSEYIQATSRVGRQADKPGLIVTIFNLNRPRDRSHYERFRFFHDTFYRNVEATSVTPFSPKALDRGLFAVTVALARLGHDYMIRNQDAEAILQHGRHLDTVAKTVAECAQVLRRPAPLVGPIEQTPVFLKVRRLLDDWSKFADKVTREQTHLLYASDSSARSRKLLHEMLDPQLANLTRAERQFKAPRSMRDVEPNVTLLPRRFESLTGWIKAKNESGRSEITQSSLRQSQLVMTYGPGAMIDLPWFAVVVSGLDFWTKGVTIPELRLESKVQAALGGMAVTLATPKVVDGTVDKETQDGVRVWRFPGWSLTQDTKRVQEPPPNGNTYLARLLVRESWLISETGMFKGPDFEKPGSEKMHSVVPIRFIRACKNGHMGDIDWANYVHQGVPCSQDLWLDDLGATGELTDLRIRCDCGLSRLISEAVGMDNHSLGLCDGARRWLGPQEESAEACGEWNRLLIRTASNAYFPQKLSVISMPDRSRAVHTAVGQFWDSHFQVVNDRNMLLAFKAIPQIATVLENFSDDEVMQAIDERRGGLQGPPARKIRVAEFELLTCGQLVIGENHHDSEFYAEEFPIAHWPQVYRERIDRVLVIHRLREVAALLGYTRFDYISPDIDGEYDLDLETARLGLNTNWVPAIENRGEGLFIQLNKERVDAWKNHLAVCAQAERMARGLRYHCEERKAKERQFFGAPYVMIHSLSHMLINAISLECGYPASSIKERIYANQDYGYGILLYTAASDSYGTLGGLASAAKSLDHYLKTALEMAQLCSNDPVCATHRADDQNQRRYLQGSACHGCLLISETSCEAFNDFLDRSLVVSTVGAHGAEFFQAD